MKLFKLKVRDDSYELFGNIVSLNEPFELDVEKATKNGETCDSFGELWSHTLSADDAGESALAAYLNDDTTITFLYVCDELKEFKGRFQTYTHEVGGRKLPDRVITPYGKVAELYYGIKTAVGEVFFCYFGKDEVTVMTRENGSIATKNNAFVMGAIQGVLEEGEGEVLLRTEKARV